MKDERQLINWVQRGLKATEIALCICWTRKGSDLYRRPTLQALVWPSQKKHRKLSNKDPLLSLYKISSFINLHYVKFYCLLWAIFIRCLTTCYLYVNKKFLYTTNLYLHPPPPSVFFISLVHYKTFTITQLSLVHFRLANCQSITSSLNSPKRQHKTRKPIRKADKPGGTLQITRIRSCHNTENDNIILQLRVYTLCKQLQNPRVIFQQH
jgi:hypothetical protein